MILTEAQYYKLKFRLAECQINRSKAQEILTLVEKQFRESMTDAGLDSAKNYTLDDKSFEVTEVTPE